MTTNSYIIPSSKCNGCTACASACPTNAITQQRDTEGTLSLVRDQNLCVQCNLCAEVCPTMLPSTHVDDATVEATGIKDNAPEVRSSFAGASGGNNIYLKTFFNEFVFFNIKTLKLECSTNAHEYNLYPISVSISRNGISLSIFKQNETLYICHIKNDGHAIFSSNKHLLDYRKNNNGTLSIIYIGEFLSARNDHSINLISHKKKWEQFTLSKEDPITCATSSSGERTIPLYWWDKPFNGKFYNIGDILSKYIVEKVSKRQVVYTPFENPTKLCAIGSIISDRTLKSGGTFWGSGMHCARVSIYNPHVKILAVRGPLTRESLLKVGYSCPEIYGDPALLLPDFYKSESKPKYKIGVIAHWRHRQKIQCKEGVLFIDILREKSSMTSFIDDICQCEMILSSSLHGIIIANAYGIPARWFMMEGFPLEGDPYKKFTDYFMSVRMPVQTPLMIAENAIIDEKTSAGIDKTVHIDLDTKPLIEAFPYDI